MKISRNAFANPLESAISRLRDDDGCRFVNRALYYATAFVHIAEDYGAKEFFHSRGDENE